MVKQEIRVDAGFEHFYEELVEAKAKLEEEIRAEFAKRAEKYDKIIAEITEVVEVEVPDEVVEEIATEETQTF